MLYSSGFRVQPHHQYNSLPSRHISDRPVLFCREILKFRGVGMPRIAQETKPVARSLLVRLPKKPILHEPGDNVLKLGDSGLELEEGQKSLPGIRAKA